MLLVSVQISQTILHVLLLPLSHATDVDRHPPTQDLVAGGALMNVWTQRCYFLVYWGKARRVAWAESRVPVCAPSSKSCSTEALCHGRLRLKVDVLEDLLKTKHVPYISSSLGSPIGGCPCSSTADLEFEPLFCGI
jgi:hypothetical protein